LKEHKAMVRLTGLGYRCWLPLCRSRDGEKARALFPGYLFVIITDSQQWIASDDRYGIMGMLRITSTNPNEVPGDVIEELRQRLALEEGGIIVLNPRPAYAKRQKLRLLKAGWEERVAFFDECDGDRLRVLFDILGRPVPVTVSYDDVQAIG
jgi:transcription antitermination factor NusG